MFGVYYSAAAAYFDLYCEAIRRAVEKVGADKVDGSAVYDAVTSMKGYKPRLYHSTLSFTKTKLVGPDTAFMYQIQDGELITVDKDLYVPNLLPGGKDVPK
jgi:hypothetical protein